MALRTQILVGKEKDGTCLREVLFCRALTGDEAVTICGVATFAGSGLEEDVGFVDEDDGLPYGGVALELKHVFFESLVVFQLAKRYLEEGFLRIFGSSFWTVR